MPHTSLTRQADLLQKLRFGFEHSFARKPELISRAPGRLEVLGNHCDYNQGCVLSLAVDRAMHVAAAKVPGRTKLCRIVDLSNGSRRQFDLLELHEPRPGDWCNYIKGLIVELQHRGIQLPAFDAALLSTVPLSAGMSSSAAFEMAMLLALLKMAQRELDWLEMAKIGQACENHYVGANTGLLDQVSSLMGKKNSLIHSDFRSMQVKHLPLPEETCFVVANSMVKHDLKNEYNERRQDCELALQVLAEENPHRKALRDLDMQELESARHKMPQRAYLRTKHVVGEMQRVSTACQILPKNDLPEFGRLLQQSQLSSKNNFDNSCPEIDALIEIGAELPGYLGARLSGGGFGGICLHLVENHCAQQYKISLAEKYQQKYGTRPDVIICQSAEGAALLE
ncbi:MAG: galactokinase [Lentisphaeria bacterium]|jgi:galactokinase|nr:galactokinase [Lentisphaeria bacterium]